MSQVGLGLGYMSHSTGRGTSSVAAGTAMLSAADSIRQVRCSIGGPHMGQSTGVAIGMVKLVLSGLP